MQNRDTINDISVTLTVQLGETKISINHLLKLMPGAILPLNNFTNTPLTFFANGKLMGTCEIVTVNNKYGIRVLEMYKKIN